jgi:hypothetical protein
MSYERICREPKERLIMEPAATTDRRAQRGANVRTALILLSIAVVFFGGVILAQYWGGSTAGIGVLGLAIIGFLLVAIVRNVRK